MDTQSEILAEIRKITIDLDEVQFHINEGREFAKHFGAPAAFVNELDTLQKDIDYKRTLVKRMQATVTRDI